MFDTMCQFEKDYYRCMLNHWCKNKKVKLNSKDVETIVNNIVCRGLCDNNISPLANVEIAVKELKGGN